MSCINSKSNITPQFFIFLDLNVRVHNTQTRTARLGMKSPEQKDVGVIDEIPVAMLSSKV